MFYWACLVGAGICECVWAIGMKYTCGFTRLWPSVITLAAMPSSMYLLSLKGEFLAIFTAKGEMTIDGEIVKEGTSLLIPPEDACLVNANKAHLFLTRVVYGYK